jgi:hypothetical protein
MENPAGIYTNGEHHEEQKQQGDTTNVVNSKEYTFRGNSMSYIHIYDSRTQQRDIQMRTEHREHIVFPKHKRHGRELYTWRKQQETTVNISGYSKEL